MKTNYAFVLECTEEQKAEILGSLVPKFGMVKVLYRDKLVSLGAVKKAVQVIKEDVQLDGSIGNQSVNPVLLEILRGLKE